MLTLVNLESCEVVRGVGGGGGGGGGAGLTGSKRIYLFHLKLCRPGPGCIKPS